MREVWLFQVHAIAGRPDRARALLTQFTSDVTDTALVRDQQPEVHALLAEIALAENRPLDAVVEFRLADLRPDGPANACSICLYARLGRAFDQAGQPDSALAMFQKYLDTPQFFRFLDTEPRFIMALYQETALSFLVPDTDPWVLAHVLRRLGELYAARNERIRAMTYYAAFVDLWRDADPELRPQVAEVQARLTTLRDVERH